MIVKRVAAEIWGAHAPRVRARRLAERTFSAVGRRPAEGGFGEAPKPAREARALPRAYAFTIIELLIVMAIILVLAGLILATSNYVQKKGYRSRAEAEIAAISAALENYKADNGVYPSNAATNGLNPTATTIDPNASLYLYKELSGDHNADRTVDNNDEAIDSNSNAISPPLTALPKTYLAFKGNMLLPAPPSNAPVIALRDPFGNPYGYSTAKAANPSGTNGFNPTFDLWSIADGSAGADQTKWIKNW